MSEYLEAVRVEMNAFDNFPEKLRTFLNYDVPVAYAVRDVWRIWKRFDESAEQTIEFFSRPADQVVTELLRISEERLAA